jgi:hypothetical protein
MHVPNQFVKPLLAFFGSSFVTMAIRGKLIPMGIDGLRRDSYPLTKTRDLTGTGARIVAVFAVLCGILLIIVGVVTCVFCAWRLNQVLR